MVNDARGSLEVVLLMDTPSGNLALLHTDRNDVAHTGGAAEWGEPPRVMCGGGGSVDCLVAGRLVRWLEQKLAPFIVVDSVVTAVRSVS